MQGVGIPSREELLLMTLHSQRKSNSTQWKKLRLRILNRDGWICFWCGMEANTCDHVIPVARGGSDDPDNLVAACKRCNFSRQDRLPEEMDMIKTKKAGLFLDGSSTATLSRGLLSPPNDSIKHD
jgi:5-methylcytosine-specific restriction endonuclease McrA